VALLHVASCDDHNSQSLLLPRRELQSAGEYTTTVYLTGGSQTLGQSVNAANTTAFGVATVTLKDTSYSVRLCNM
jgi:hypothetical protein